MEDSKEKIRLASFDIGKKNFAQYVEECDVETLYALRDRYRALPKIKQRRVKGKMNDDIREILSEVCLGGTRVHLGVYDFRENKESDVLDMAVRKNLIDHLEKNIPLWNECDGFIIEQQYFAKFNQRGGRGAKTEANIDAIKIAEGTLVWFLSNYPNKEVMYFSSTFKTQMLGAPRLKETERKKWAIEKAKEIHTQRNDKNAIALYDLSLTVKGKRMNSEEKIQGYLDRFPGKGEDIREVGEKVIRYKQKLCDISDAMLQLQAFKYRTFIGEF
uniref:Holliday junction resolvase n=1 Tax=Marseillevirus LCMAC101 TaxID=2506602 RepID=A0A481YQP6_9VIRU|nr:MAG: holliday junction resolvase [Marseillevirus LCMAC101]